ncbi:MAG: endonuclease III [Deltaproteobacteria bacterium]|nr:endonuclease III [Deltaproteobacteria bacterium]
MDAKKSEIAARALEALRELYPQTRPHLEARDPWELLVATVLAAQCTDARVNRVTPELFRRLPTVRDFALVSQAELENLIRSTGFFRNKAKNLILAAGRVVDVYNGEVPDNMADLLTLGGVARKTANVVLWEGFGKNEGLAVDTHVARICARLGLCVPLGADKVAAQGILSAECAPTAKAAKASKGKCSRPAAAKSTPESVEKELCAVFPRSEWGNVNHRMVSFGRDICTARTPACSACPMLAFCPQLLGDGGNKGAGQKIVTKVN